MKIVHVIHSIDPRSGGPSGTLRALATAQVALGDKVCIITTDVQSAEPWAKAAAYRQQLRDDKNLKGIELSERMFGDLHPDT
ncbi:MAG: hypothetical protein ABI579_08225, partial [Candidatus Sumerlaeota bacterium]